MKVSHLFVTLCALLVFGASAWAAPKTLTPEQAVSAVGQTATVCGIAASVHFAYRSHGQPTFVNLEKPYPNQVFTIVIWGSDRGRFKPSPESWQGKKICVTGLIKSYRGNPEVIARSPEQITVK
ncbi:MAG: DNA-binding protein [Candidatus Micrarchaeaceae archaeon]